MLRLAYAFSLALAFAGCGQPCDSSHICNVDSDGLLCDGNDYKACDDSNRGQMIGCQNSPRIAVCTNDGWTFQDAPK